MEQTFYNPTYCICINGGYTESFSNQDALFNFIEDMPEPEFLDFCLVIADSESSYMIHKP